MKKIFTVITLILLVLGLVSCDISNIAQETDTDTETEETTESVFESAESESETKGEEYTFDILPRCSDYSSYLRHRTIMDNDLKAGSVADLPQGTAFVSFDELLGETNSTQDLFAAFIIYKYYPLEGGQSDPTRNFRYQYQFWANYFNAAEQKISLTVLHGDLPDNLTKKEKSERPEQYFREWNIDVTDHASNDLRYYRWTAVPVDYFCNGIRYTYERGNLTEIHWQSGDTKFWFTFEEPLYSPTYDIENTGAWNYPLFEKFLRKDQTADAIAWFDELITSEERALDSGS